MAQKLAPHVDFLLCETVASVAHARSILEGAKTAGKPVWLSVTVDDEDGSRLRSGEPVAEVVHIAREGGAEAGVALGPFEVVFDIRFDGDSRWWGLRGDLAF